MALPNAPSTKDRILGAIIDVCACDALGGPVQFQKRGSFKPVTRYRYIEQFDMPPGAWSDDGSLTLCLAQSLIDNRLSLDKADLSAKFVAWFKTGYMSVAGHTWDVGRCTTLTLGIWLGKSPQAEAAGRPIDAVKAQHAVNKLSKIASMSGNGSLMRVAPIGATMFTDVEKAAKAARDQSEITHPYPTCAEACEIYTRLIAEIMRGESDQASLARTVAEMTFAGAVLSERLQQYQTLHDWLSRPEEEISSSGWVVDTLEAALWAFFTISNFEAGALKVVNLGDDSDSVGAVFGGLAGAYYGVEAVPAEWRRGLVKSALVERVASELASMVAE